jgi:Na+:H+ antiporter, NhaA family
MSESQKIVIGLARLPNCLIDRLTKPFVYFLRIEAAAGSALFLFTLVALILPNLFGLASTIPRFTH